VLFSINIKHNGSVLVSMLAMSAVDHGFEHWSGQTKDYKIGTSSSSPHRNVTCYRHDMAEKLLTLF
jgi:hypothetical protein